MSVEPPSPITTESGELIVHTWPAGSSVTCFPTARSVAELKRLHRRSMHESEELLGGAFVESSHGTMAHTAKWAIPMI